MTTVKIPAIIDFFYDLTLQLKKAYETNLKSVCMLCENGVALKAHVGATPIVNRKLRVDETLKFIHKHLSRFSAKENTATTGRTSGSNFETCIKYLISTKHR